MIKFYSVPGTSATTVHFALEELGADYKLVQVERRNRDNPAEFKQVNPLGRVGAIDDDGVKVYETGAILLYLGDKFEDKKLAPKINTSERADYYRWIVYLSNTIHAGYMPYYLAGRLTSDELAQKEISDASAKSLVESFRYIDSQLEGKDYLLGDEFSLADLYLYMLACPNWTITMAEEVDKMPNLKAHWERINNRENVKNVLKIHAEDKSKEQAGLLSIG